MSRLHPLKITGLVLLGLTILGLVVFWLVSQFLDHMLVSTTPPQSSTTSKSSPIKTIKREAYSLDVPRRFTDLPSTYRNDEADYLDVATVDGIKIVYYRRYVKHEDTLYQVTTWTLPSKEAVNKQTLLDIMTSLRIGPDMVDSI